MAKFETIVRPVVFPNIRPAPARSLPPEDDTGEGVVIRGNAAKSFELSMSYSFSASSSRTEETQRRVDEVRVSQMDDDGNVNRSNFVDIQVANKLWKKGIAPLKVAPLDKALSPTGSVELLRYLQTLDYYLPVEEKKNLEFRKKNEILKRENPKLD